jgi:hypothetical protein
MMPSWRSYPSIFGFGHREAQELLDSGVTLMAQEKVDGSQFSFGRDEDGALHAKSKGKELDVDEPQEKMFALACDTVRTLGPALEPGFTYRGEYLRVPKHNTLMYGRVPAQHIIIYDINNGHESYLPPSIVMGEAHRLGLDCVPTLGSFSPNDPLTLDRMRGMLDTESILGGCKIEGVVIKPVAYDVYGKDKKVLMAKYVSEAFKEMHRESWKVGNPGRADVVEALIRTYKTNARWEKAVQHLRDEGRLGNEPKDIGILMKALGEDLAKECRDHAAEVLIKHFWPQIARGAAAGFAEWYKERLLQLALANQPGHSENSSAQILGEIT